MKLLLDPPFSLPKYEIYAYWPTEIYLGMYIGVQIMQFISSGIVSTPAQDNWKNKNFPLNSTWLKNYFGDDDE